MKKLTDARKLILIRLAHTLIWAAFVAAILYVCYAGMVGKIDTLLWCCVGAVLLEGIVLLFNKWRCPLTLLAYKYTNTHPAGFDIYLPKWLAGHNKAIFTGLFLVGLSLVLWRVLYPR